MWTIVLFVLFSTNVIAKEREKPKIAIIGGGIGGTSCAYFLRSLLGTNVEIDLFERLPILGGRLATIEMSKRLYESGGSIIHKRNKYMSDFADLFGLKKIEHASSNDELAGIFNGEQYAFQESSWSIVTILKLLWRYGYDIFRMNSAITQMLNRFDRIYEHQSKGRAYTTVGNLLGSMDASFVTNVGQDLEKYLSNKGFSKLFSDELAGVAVRVNYGQKLDITAFAGNVALAGAQNDLWSVQSGNRRVAEALFNNSKATLRQCEVEKITKISNRPDDKRSSFSVHCNSTKDSSENYDTVILAVPLIENVTQLRFENLNVPKINYGNYHRLIATFIEGELNETAFGACKSKSNLIFGDRCPDQILVCCDDELWFNSVSTLKSIDSKSEPKKKGSRVWKVFSSELLSSDQVNRLFKVVSDRRDVEWLAYPHYAGEIETVNQRVNEAKFEPVDGLYHVNIIEWAASAMEMSVIGAKNVAWLAYDRLKNSFDLDLKMIDVKKDYFGVDAKNEL